MNAKQFAALLNGREYRKEVSRAESAQAKAAGLIVAFGYSDDNLELRGLVDDEISAYNGTVAEIRLDIMEPVEDEACPDCVARAGVIKVHAEWSPKDLNASWLITPSVPFEPFDIMEDGELFCRGAVFAAPAPAGAGTNYIADHESQPKQFKFANGRRVWITAEGYLDTDFGPLAPQDEAPAESAEGRPDPSPTELLDVTGHPDAASVSTPRAPEAGE